MATSKPSVKKQAVKKTTKQVAKAKIVDEETPLQQKPWYRRALTSIAKRRRNFLSRRPHRSFRMTRRRDYRRSLKLPGLIAFTYEVHKILWKNRRTFALMVVGYSVLIAIFLGVTSQDAYSQLSASVTQAANQASGGNWGAVGNAALVLLATITGSSTTTPDPGQQAIGILLGLLVWLTTVWLLRNILAGHRVKVRDGIYKAGAPIVSTFIVFVVLLVQLLPFALALVGFVAASTTGLLDNGVQAMLFWAAAGLLTILSLYWITATFIGLVVVTLPGMYPLRALRIAGDMVVGRRLRILGRVLWMLFVVVILWLVITIPVILFDSWLKNVWPAISWLPTVPVTLLILSSLTVVWAATYIYLLYRKVVDDDALPA